MDAWEIGEWRIFVEEMTPEQKKRVETIMALKGLICG